MSQNYQNNNSGGSFTPPPNSNPNDNLGFPLANQNNPFTANGSNNFQPGNSQVYGQNFTPPPVNNNFDSFNQGQSFNPNPSFDNPNYDPNINNNQFLPPASNQTDFSIDPNNSQNASYSDQNNYSTDFSNPNFPNPGLDPNTFPNQENDFNLDPNYNQQFGTPEPNQQPYDPNNFNPDYNNFDGSTSQQVTAFNTGGFDQGFNPNQNPQQNPNTFKERKSGNNLFAFIAGGIVLILLITTGVLYYAQSQMIDPNSVPGEEFSQDQSSSSSSNLDLNNQSSSESSSSSSERNTNFETNPASPNNPNNNSDNQNSTPAALSKVNSETVIPSSWLQQKFFNTGLNSDGSCQNLQVCGNNADPDSDGLKNIEEYNYDTDPQEADTDGDQLADGNEVFVYLSSPKNPDSDNDEIADGEELLKCFDPISTSPSKMSAGRLNRIAEENAFIFTREPTSTLLNSAEATPEDIRNGYLGSACANFSVEL